MSFIAENGGTLLVGLILLAIVLGVIVHLVKQRRSGASSCGCGGGCSGCGGSCSSTPSIASEAKQTSHHNNSHS